MALELNGTSIPSSGKMVCNGILAKTVKHRRHKGVAEWLEPYCPKQMDSDKLARWLLVQALLVSLRLAQSGVQIGGTI